MKLLPLAELCSNKPIPDSPMPDMSKVYADALERQLVQDFCNGEFSVKSEMELPEPLKERLCEVVKEAIVEINKRLLADKETK